MGKIICAFIGHKYRRGNINSLKHGLVASDIFMCLRCKKTKEAPATPYTPMDIPPPAQSQEGSE